MNNDKITVRKTCIDDIDEILAIERSNSEFVGQYDFDKHKSLLVDADCLHLSIFDNSDGALVGYVILFGLIDPNDSIEFRRIAISRKGHGFGKHAVKTITTICFSERRKHRLFLSVFSDNISAIGLYESLGFKKDGLLRDCVKWNWGYRSMWTMSMLESEYNSEN